MMGQRKRAIWDYVIFTKVVTLTLTFIGYSKKNFAKVLVLEDISCQNIMTIRPAVWPVHPSDTDKQTNRQTDRQTHKPR